MKNSKNIKLVICIVICVAFLAIAIYMITNNGSSSGRSEVADEYKYNTVIETNPNAPKEGEAQSDKIVGYVEDNDQKIAKLPMKLDVQSGGETINLIEIVSIGEYSGSFTETEKPYDVEKAFAMVIKNPSDKVLSIASLTVEYADSKTCNFAPSNIPPKQSALILTSSEVVNYSDVKKFECSVDYAVPQDELPMLEGKVGVDYKDGQFVVTNLTGEVLGDVYIRFKTCESEANAYLGSVTHSVCAQGVQPYETYLVDAPNYNPDTSVIIAVDNYISQ